MPSATEMIYSLGLQDDLFGVTHECDYPLAAKEKPKLTKSLLQAGSSSEIDRRVRESLKSGKGIYSIDYENLRKANPDVIFTQELCEVCAVSYGEIYRASKELERTPEIVSLDTFKLDDIINAIMLVGEKCKRERESKELLRSLKIRIDRVSGLVQTSQRKRKSVFFMEWIDPVMSCGHWMPELIRISGGVDILGQDGKNSRIVEWKEVLKASPEYIVIAPCGFGVERALVEARRYLPSLEGWQSIPAVCSGNVFVSDGNAFFSRPGPRIVDGLEILASLLNPGIQEYSYKYGNNDFARFSN